ncbi:LptF/LptG family permease [bacterium]|nr:LptF/LptG family permease [bacterium]
MKRGSLLTRWILQELAMPMLAVFGGFLLFALLAMDLYQMVDLVAAKQVPPSVVLHLLVLRFPFWVVFAIPVSLLFGLFIGIARLSQDGEVRAIRTLGTSRRALFLRLIIAGIGISALAWTVQESFVSRNLQEYFQIVARFTQSDLLRRVETGRFLAGPHRMHYYFGGITPEGGLEDIRILKVTPSDAPEELLLASHGAFEGETLHLYSGSLLRFGDGGTRIRFRESFEEVEIDMGREFSETIPIIDSPFVDSAARLWEKVTEHRASPRFPSRLLAREETELHYRYSLPLANLVFVLFAFPLALRMGKRGQTSAFFVAVVAFALYWGAIGVGRALGATEVLPPALAGWAPNLLFGLGGLFSLWRDESA